LERLAHTTGAELPDTFTGFFAGNPDPDLALRNLERWLATTASPWMHFQQIAGVPELGRLLVLILGASQPLADSLIQNPELSSIVLEPGELRRTPSRPIIVGEGTSLLASSTSFTHSLDRLRFLRQRWNLPIVINDLAGTWPQEVVWRALSDLADSLIELAAKVTWEDQGKQRELPPTSPVLIVGFGKLGGHELNYSSDVDLVYVCEDGQSEKLERDCGRYCEALGRSLSNRMGRGSLYRVDLRLRPYGGAGPIVRSMRSVEAYYNLYAEPWEIQALLRSRPIQGPPELWERWEALRTRTCFRPKLSEVSVEEMLAMRARIEEGASEDDLKRGAGGFRVVDFLTQVLQIVV
jgi:glutamate-ammonia-ligase adenylyltransferase